MCVADYYFSLLVYKDNYNQLHCRVQKKSKDLLKNNQKISQFFEIFGQNCAVLMPPEPF